MKDKSREDLLRYMRRKIVNGLRKSMALFLSLAVFAGTVDMRAYATEAEVEIVTEVEAAEEQTVAVEESVTVVETETTGEFVEESKEESLTEEITVEIATEEISPVEDTEEEIKDLTVEETTEVEATEEITETAETEEADSTWDGVTTVSVYEAGNYTVTFTLNSEWGTGYNASVQVENTGDSVIHDWHLEYASMHTITNIWNAVVYESTDDTCVIKNAGWNQDILAGASVEFGFSVEGVFTGFPESYQLLGDKVEANTDDYAISYQLDSDWGNGFSGSISITNNTDTTLEDWTLEFDFAREITSIWNATIESYEDNHYVIMNAGYNENIGIGQTISFGFNGQGGVAEDIPENYELYTYEIADDTLIQLEDGKIDKAYIEQAIYPNLLLKGQSIEHVKLSDDFDGDGLTLIQEYNYDTNPFVKDTDEDGLTDDEEINTYGTNPIKRDTDNDGMSDGTEVSCGLDPHEADTDGDGVTDNEETIKQEVRIDRIEQYQLQDVDTLPTVEITGQGDYSQKIYAVADTYNKALNDIDALVGTPFEFVHDEEMTFDSSKLSFTVSDEILDENAIEDLAIAWYNYEENALELLETTCDKERSTISAEVEHYSTYMVVSVPDYFFNIDWENTENIIEAGKADVVFVVDTTGSMYGEIQNVKNNIQKFVSELEENKVDIRLGLVEYKDIYADGVGSTKSYEWYKDVPAFQEGLDALDVYGGGDGPESVVDALNCARGMNYRTGVKKYIILLTDANYKNGTSVDAGATMEQEIEKLVEEEFVVSAVTNTYYYSVYNELVTSTDGVSANINQNFATALTPLIDKMGEQVNKGCWIRLSNGSVVSLEKDPTLGDDTVDTDGDEIPDIIELKGNYKVKALNPYTGEMQEIDTWSFYSNPVEADTDGDGLKDLDDMEQTVYDIVVIEETDSTIRFNTGRTWYNISCNSFDYLDNLMQMVDGHVENPIPIEEFKVILQNVKDNDAQDFCIEELCYIGIVNNEGSKLYMQSESSETREIIFQCVIGRESKYYRHSGIFSTEKWEEVAKGTESGFFTGAVLTEADINFSCELYYIVDVYTVLESLVEIGVVVIAIILVAEMMPVVVANVEALAFYVKNFGIVQGLNMYRYLGLGNLPNGVISWLQMDMADGDTSLDDTTSGATTVWNYIKSTQPKVANTEIPKSFEITANGGKFWVHPNGTKHMIEYITRNLKSEGMSHGMPMNSQTLLSSFKSAIDSAIVQGITYEQIMYVGNWELIFSSPRAQGLLPVIKHAVYFP